MRGRAGRGPIRSGLWFGVGNKVAKAARAHGHMGGRIDDLEYVPATMAGERRLGQDRAAGSKARTAMPQIVSPDPPALSFQQDRISLDDALAATPRQGDAAFRLARRPSGDRKSVVWGKRGSGRVD